MNLTKTREIGVCLRMSQSESNARQQDEESSIGFSLQLALIAAILTTVADAIAALAALEAIEEAKAAESVEQQKQKDMNDQFKNMQEQIDMLKDELAAIKSTNRPT